MTLTVQVAANYYASFTGGVECLKLGDLPEPPYSVEFMLNMNLADATGPVGLELANAFPGPAKDGAFAVFKKFLKVGRGCSDTLFICLITHD